MHFIWNPFCHTNLFFNDFCNALKFVKMLNFLCTKINSIFFILSQWILNYLSFCSCSFNKWLFKNYIFLTYSLSTRKHLKSFWISSIFISIFLLIESQSTSWVLLWLQLSSKGRLISSSRLCLLVFLCKCFDWSIVG